MRLVEARRNGGVKCHASTHTTITIILANGGRWGRSEPKTPPSQCCVVGARCSLLRSPKLSDSPINPNQINPIDVQGARASCSLVSGLYPSSATYPDTPPHIMATTPAVAAAKQEQPQQQQHQQEQPPQAEAAKAATGLLAAYLDADLPYTHEDFSRVRCTGCMTNKRCVACCCGLPRDPPKRSIPLGLRPPAHGHTRTHTHIYIYIYMYAGSHLFFLTNLFQLVV
jgi:hypothetical protein